MISLKYWIRFGGWTDECMCACDHIKYIGS